MPLAEVETTIVDGALALALQDPTSVSAKVGMATAGAFDTIYLLTRAGDAKTRFTGGPLVEASAYHVARSTKQVYAARIDGSVAGVAGAITKSNGASPTITASGTPIDDFAIVVEITATGTLASLAATGSFRYSVDGGDTDGPGTGTWTPSFALPTPPVSTAAIVTGTGDLSAGGLYGGGGTLTTLTVIANINGAGSVTCTFAAPANKAAVLTQLNTAFGGTHFTAPGNFLIINSTTLGTAGSIDITGGTALVALGLVVATTNGVNVPATYVLGDTGLTWTFPLGNYTEDDTYTEPCTAPNYTLSDLGDTLDVFLGDHQKLWFCMHVVGVPADEEDTRALADALKTFAEDAEALHRFMFVAMEAADVDKDLLLTEFSDFESSRVAVGHEFEELQSEATRDSSTKRVFRRPSMWPMVKRIARVELSEDGGFIGRGKLLGVVSAKQEALDAAEEMNDARFCTLREVIGKSGTFLARPRTFAASGSDFTFLVYRRIMDEACRITRSKFVDYLVAKLFADAVTGFVDERSARAIEDDVNAALLAGLVTPGHASRAFVSVDRATNILSTQILLVETRVIPPSFAGSISHTIGFLNPAATG
jgi:hypothetical protein